MALTGEYALSPAGWVREQTEKILETGTTTSVATSRAVRSSW